MFFDGISADNAGVLTVLAMLYAAEKISEHAYQVHAQALTGMDAPGLEDELLEHAKEEAHHAHLLSDIIRNLGGTIPLRVGDLPAFSFNDEDAETAADNAGMLALDLAAERKAIAAYTEAIRMLRDTDYFDVAVTLSKILADEREHASDLQSWLS
jgi:bacterioferritin (cytochrome b1)